MWRQSCAPLARLGEPAKRLRDTRPCGVAHRDHRIEHGAPLGIDAGSRSGPRLEAPVQDLAGAAMQLREAGIETCRLVEGGLEGTVVLLLLRACETVDDADGLADTRRLLHERLT